MDAVVRVFGNPDLCLPRDVRSKALHRRSRLLLSGHKDQTGAAALEEFLPFLSPFPLPRPGGADGFGFPSNAESRGERFVHFSISDGASVPKRRKSLAPETVCTC